jgi:hypothetical protein
MSEIPTTPQDPLSGSDADDLAGVLSFTDNVSVGWTTVPEAPSDEQLAKVNESNEAFLRAVAVLSTAGLEMPEEESSASSEIARLDLKVNMLLDLVSQLIYAQLDIPERTQVTVGAQSLSWRGSTLPDPGAIVFMQVYIEHGTPKPLCFYGEVISTAADHAAGQATVNYQGLSQAARGWLEKLIFRHHRREIAFRRAHSQQE